MSDDIFTKLRERLDTYSLGYPETESGVEIKILKKLFSEEEAELFLAMTLLLEAPESVADRTGLKAEEVAERLEVMAKKGLLFRLRKDQAVRYAASAFVIGIFEYQLKTIDKELAELAEEYFKEKMLTQFSGSAVPLRTVPVNESIDASMQVAPYSDAREIVKSAKKMAIANCVCRVQQGKLDDDCDKPKEVCFSFGSHADYYVENGLGRYIDQEEALSILAKSEESGLVVQPTSMINPGGMCNCCGDCCAILRSLKATPNPASQVMNDYFAIIDEEECSGCETCLERCQIEAIKMNDDETASVITERCIGCGLCVTTCPTEAVKMKLKPESERADIPDNAKEWALKIAELRGVSLFPQS